MATSVLTQNHLLFKDSSQVDQVKLTSNAGFLHLAHGALAAACEIKNVADGTHANSAVTKQQLEASISTSESVDAAARSNMSSTLTANDTADIATQAAASLAGRNTLQANIDSSEESARIAGINSEASSRASAITAEQNARHLTHRRLPTGLPHPQLPTNTTGIGRGGITATTQRVRGGQHSFV
jgi:hypothetical protein